MEHWIDVLTTRPGELVVGFIAGNALWFSRQFLWQQWVKRSHRTITEENRKEEEKTRQDMYRGFQELKELLGKDPLG